MSAISRNFCLATYTCKGCVEIHKEDLKTEKEQILLRTSTLTTIKYMNKTFSFTTLTATQKIFNCIINV